MVLLDFVKSPIRDQVASVVLDLHGNVVTVAGSVDYTTKPTPSTTPFGGATTEAAATIDTTTTKILYQIFLEVGSLQLPSFRRITISSLGNSDSSAHNIRYLLSRDEAYIYIVAQRHD